ncbi:MAG: GAF domain-containing protein, partial [Nitrospirota bacterium]
MSLRGKLTVFTIVFFLLTAALIAGSFLIFSRLSSTFDIQRSLMKEHNLHEDWKSSIVSVVMAAEGWAVTGEVKFQRQYKQRLKEAYTFFNGLPEAVRNKKEVKAIRADFDKMKEFASAIMSAKQPVGDIHVLFALRMLKDKEREAYEKLGAIHSESVLKLTNTIAQGERIERQMGFYLVVLFGLSSLAIMSLIIFMKRIITAPFDGLMKATEKISGGELHYRIGSERRDEFGVIAKRFDEMVEKLQASRVSNEELYASTKNQLQELTVLYELITAVTSAMDLDEILGTVTSEITRLLGARGCIIRLLMEGDILKIKSSYGLAENLKEHMDLTLGSGIAGWVAKEGEPLLVDDVSEMPPEMRVPVINVKSAICVPLKVEGKVIGTLGIYDKIGSDGNILP